MTSSHLSSAYLGYEQRDGFRLTCTWLLLQQLAALGMSSSITSMSLPMCHGRLLHLLL